MECLRLGTSRINTGRTPKVYFLRPNEAHCSIDHLYQDPHINAYRLFLHYGDIADSTNLIQLFYRLQPDEIYHLAAQSHVRVSFDIPEYTGDVTGLGTIRILEAIRETGLRAKFYQASSSEMYGTPKIARVKPPSIRQTNFCTR